MKKLFDINGLSHLHDILTNMFDKKVDKTLRTGSSTRYKVLSDNNFTDSEKSKLSRAQTNAIETILINGVPLVVDNEKKVSFLLPTKLSELLNDTDFQNANEVNAAIEQAIGDITQIDFVIVNQLPPVGKKGTFYLVPVDPTDENNNDYDEYYWINNEWEKLGTRKIDLSDYYTKEEANILYARKESLSNKTIELSELSTDSEYPSAKCVFEFVTTSIEEAIDEALTNRY